MAEPAPFGELLREVLGVVDQQVDTDRQLESGVVVLPQPSGPSPNAWGMWSDR